MTGKSMTSAIAKSRRTRSQWTRACFLAAVRLGDLIRDLTLAHQKDVEITEGEHDDGQEDRHRCALAELHRAEERLVDARAEDFRGDSGPSAGHHIDEIERLERPDEVQSCGDQDHPPGVGHRDVPEGGPRVGPVQVRGLVLLRLVQPERRPVHEHDEGSLLPDVCGDDRRHRGRRLAEPRDVLRDQAEPHENLVQDPVGAVGDPSPREGPDDVRQHPGDEDHRPDQPPGRETGGLSSRARIIPMSRWKATDATLKYIVFPRAMRKSLCCRTRA